MKRPSGGVRLARVLRVVETQYAAATMRLVATPEAQAVLEAALEASKPRVPPAFAHLHYLLSTPFRYAPSPWPSRFRGPTDPGVFHGAEHERTALAEVAHWRLAVLRDAHDLPALDPAAHTLFAVDIAATTAEAALLRPAARRAAILHPSDYAAAQTWAREAREAGWQAIRYSSVRGSPEGVCWAIFAAEAFVSQPALVGTWLLRVTREMVHCRTTVPPVEQYAFSAAELGG